MLFWHFFRHLVFSRRAGSLIRRIAMLSSGAIFLSVTAFLIVLFVMKGMNASIEDRVIALEPHLVATPDASLTPEQIEQSPLVKKLAADPNIRWSLFESQDVILRSLDGQFRGTNARGLDPRGLKDFLTELRRLQREQLSTVTSIEVDKASELWDPNEELQEGEVLIGIDLARQLGLFDGDPVLVISPESLLLPPGEAPRTERLRVKRVISTNLSDLDAQLFLYVRGKALRSLHNSPSRQMGIEIRLPDGNRAPQFRASLGPTPGFRIETWGERNSDLFFALKLEKVMIGTFLALAGLVAGSSILTVMVLLLTQKRRDIALLRVLGLSGVGTVKLFTRIGLTLAGGGIVAGAVVGLAVGLWIQHHPLTVLPDIYYDSQIPAQVDWPLAFGTLVVAGLLAFFGAWVPSRSLADLPPNDVLRGKN